MSALASNTHELIWFAGAVQIELADGAVNLVLRGLERTAPGSRGGLAELLFSGAAAVTLPPDLRDARVLELAGPASSSLPASGAGPAPRRYRIESPQLQLELQARSAQLHRDVAAAFFAAVPPPQVPLRVRLGWSLLLWGLRIPGAAVLFRKLRGST